MPKLNIFPSPKTCLITFIVFLIAHSFIFRGIIYNIPEILSGDKVLTAEELIPFFDWNTQFFDQVMNSYSDLTRSEEVRVGYSFLTSWVRYYKFLPFSIIILNTISIWILCFAVLLLLRRVYENVSEKWLVLSAGSAALVVHLILLYAKITHFYTLIFGFSLFSLCTSLFIVGFCQQRPYFKYIITAALLDLVNPAVHYHLLSIIVWTVVIFTFALFNVSRTSSKQVFKNLGLAMLVLLLVSITPYFLYIKHFILSKLDDKFGVECIIPVTYNIIQSTSSSLIEILSFQIAGPINQWLHGRYNIPQVEFLAYSLLLVAPIVFLFYRKKCAKLARGETNMAIIFPLYMMLLIAVWMSLGYQSPFSFHSIIATIARTFHTNSSLITNLGLKATYNLIHILRFPHRFQFIFLYSSCVLISITIVMSLMALDELRVKRLYKRLMKLAIPILLLVPLISNVDYRTVLVSGNFSDFLEPYAIAEDLKAIRRIVVGDRKPGRILLLPSVRYGFHVRDLEGNVHVLHDKFYIYYLNVPSVLYSEGNLQNCMHGFLLYHAFKAGLSSWIDVLRNNEIKYIVFNKEAIPKGIGPLYLWGIEKQIWRCLLHSPNLRLVYNGSRYLLFEIIPLTERKSGRLLVITDWYTYFNFLIANESTLSTHNIVYCLRRQQVEKPEKPSKCAIIPSKGFKFKPDDYLLTKFSSSNPYILPFSRQSSSLIEYINPMVKLFTLMEYASRCNWLKKTQLAVAMEAEPFSAK